MVGPARCSSWATGAAGPRTTSTTTAANSTSSRGRCGRDPDGDPARGHRFPGRVPPVPGPAAAEQVDPALVRRGARDLDDLPGVLPGRALRGLRCRPCRRALGFAGSAARAPAGPRGRGPGPADRSRAAGEPRGSDRLDPAAPGRPRRGAVPAPLHDGAARPGLVRAGLPGALALPALRAVERRFAGRTADVSLPGRAPLGASGAGRLLDVDVPGLRRPLRRGGPGGLASRRGAGDRSSGGARAFGRTEDPLDP